MDQAHEWTDEQIERISRRIKAEYSHAKKDMLKKLEEWPDKLEEERAELKRALDAKEITKRQYRRALLRLETHEKWLNAMVEELAVGTMSTTEHAMAIVNDELPGICAENMNYATYRVERSAKADTMWTLVDEDTVRLLFKEDRELLPFMEVDPDKAVKWNSKKFQSAITQGILQGESVPDIAKRIQSVIEMSEKAANRAARTACTGAENAGRTHAHQRAREMGIGVLNEWRATLDSRTRLSHRQMNGQRVVPGEKFSNGCIEPGDPSGPADEVWNCRCTLVGYVEGTNYGKNNGQWFRDETISGVSYEEWLEGKDLEIQRAKAAEERKKKREEAKGKKK